MLSEIAPEELLAVLETIAVNLLCEAGVARPPVDAFALAAALSITVALDASQGSRARFVRLADHRRQESQPTIFLRPDPRRERRHWAVAHEVGEAAAWRVFAALAIDPREAEPMARETVANLLASRILLPGAWFAADAASCGWDLLRLKAIYRTASHELIARRMLDFSPPVVISLFDQRRLSWRRSNIPGRAPPPSAAELRCWRDVHRRNRRQAVHDGVRSIRGWPVHERLWRREILRTAWDDAAE